MIEVSLTKDYLVVPLTQEMAVADFSCGESDLDDFFHSEAILYAKERLGKTYCVIKSEEFSTIVGFFTVANDSIKTTYMEESNPKNRIQRNIPNEKRLRSYPAVLIGRLGVDKKYQGKEFQIGRQIIEYLKAWFYDDDNKTGCRFLVVDAYNSENVLSFYERNDFKFLYRDEEMERTDTRIKKEAPLRTRMMFFDLIGKQKR